MKDTPAPAPLAIVAPEGASPLALIEKVVESIRDNPDKAANLVDVVERLVKLRREMATENAEAEFAAAFARLQAALGTFNATKKVPDKQGRHALHLPALRRNHGPGGPAAAGERLFRVVLDRLRRGANHPDLHPPALRRPSPRLQGVRAGRKRTLRRHGDSGGRRGHDLRQAVCAVQRAQHRGGARHRRPQRGFAHHPRAGADPPRDGGGHQERRGRVPEIRGGQDLRGDWVGALCRPYSRRCKRRSGNDRSRLRPRVNGVVRAPSRQADGERV